MREKKQNDSSLDKGLKITTLGQFRIALKNGDLYNTSSRANKLWALFKLLLINHNKGITPEIILEYLSPEIDYVDPSHIVQNMIYRLRKLVSSEAIFVNRNISILFSNGCYKLNLEEDSWIDFIELEKSVNKAELIRTDNPLQALEYYRFAFDIYGGELLPELYYENWVVPHRTYYSNLYIKIIANLCKLYAEQGLYDSVIEVCQQGLVIEPYEEAIHIRLMENLMNIGRIKEAKAHYEKTVSVFQKEFGIQPTPAMQQIAQLFKSELVQINTRHKASPSLMAEEEKGAVFCDYRDFYTMYVLEKRNCERSGNALCPIYIEFENSNNIFQSKAHKNSAIDKFKETLVNGLRKGDLISLVNKSRFFVLLHNAEYQTVKMVMARIIDQYHVNSAFKDIILDLEVCPSLPKPNGK